MTSNERREEFLRVNSVLESCSKKTGALPQKIQSDTGEIINREGIFEELGDYAPYVLYGGKIFEEKAKTEWINNHVLNAIKSAQSSVGLFHTEAIYKNKEPKFIYSIKNADTINGLVSIFLINKNKEVKESIEKFFSGLQKFFIKDNLISYAVNLKSKKKLPIANTLATAYFAEELINFSEITSQKKYIKESKNLIEPYLHDRTWQINNLFPARKYIKPIAKTWYETALKIKGRVSSNTSVIVKDNAYMVFSLIRLYEITKENKYKEACEKWAESFFEKTYRDGVFTNEWQKKSKKENPAPLQKAHSMIECFTELFRVYSHDKYLKKSEEIVNHWRKFISQTGTVEEIDGCGYSLLDPNIDFGVELIRLGEVAGKSNFIEEGVGIIENSLSRFRSRFGYAWKINIQTGEVLKKNIETKYIGLAIKGLLVVEMKSRGENIYGNPELQNISRDR